MPKPFPSVSAEATSTRAYGAGYYLGPDGQPLSTFNFDADRDTARARAIADVVGISPGASVLDFGCGLGTMTAAFGTLDYRVVGVDPSPHAIENAVPQANGLVRQLGRSGLAGFPNDSFDLVLVKDVFEHIGEDDLHGLVKVPETPGL